MSDPISSATVQNSADLASVVSPVPLVDFGQLQTSQEAGGDRATEVDVQIVLGSTTLQTVAAEQLDCGSVVALDQSAEAPASVYVDGRLVARGDLVAVDNHYALRITELAADPAQVAIGQQAVDST